MKEEPKISDLSAHLFWDCDQSKITWDGHSTFLVGRILEYGMMKDWLLLKQAYGIRRIGEIAQTLRSLNAVSLNFISKITNTPENEFRCYTWKQLHPTLWNS